MRGVPAFKAQRPQEMGAYNGPHTRMENRRVVLEDFCALLHGHYDEIMCSKDTWRTE